MSRRHEAPWHGHPTVRQWGHGGTSCLRYLFPMAFIIVMPSYRQPICDTCWDDIEPGREPVRLVEDVREIEQCCMCGDSTLSGIYIRVNPKAVPYPQS
jgi:hypothetical protein